MMTMKLVVDVVLIALYLLAWVIMVMLGLELRSPRRRDPMSSPIPADSHANRETTIRQAFTAEDDVDGEGARPSSLIPYYHHKPDRAYLLQLKYAVEKANEEAMRLYGPLPPGGLPVQKKTKPRGLYQDFQENEVPQVQPIIEESDEMKLKEMATAVALTAGMAACQSEANGLQSFDSPKNQNHVTYASESTRIVLSKQCGDFEVQLTCPMQSNALDCKQTALSITRSGALKKIDRPQEMVDYTAVGLSCASSAKDGRWYFVVQYGELPEGCSYCEWLYLYDDNGKRVCKLNCVTAL